MQRAVTKHGVFGELQQLITALTANEVELTDLMPSRLRLQALVSQAQDADAQQAAHAASKQEASKNLRASLTEAKRLATVVRLALKAHYGIRSEKLAEFDVQPFRGRKIAEDLKPPAPPPPVIEDAA
jgi:hypothetical protein